MKKLTLFLVALTMILFSCKPEIEKPTVATKSVGEITKTTATVSGDVTSDGGAEVSERGVCWNTEGAPTILDSRTKDGTGIGSFTSNLSDLTPQTTYYVRTYATNEAGTAYGEEKTFTTLADEPEQPGDEPEQPGDEPEQPGDEPEQPGDEPEQPGDEPEQPEKPEDPKGLPIVITGEVHGIDLTYAYCDGEVISSGDAAVVARGVCWNTTGNPTFSDAYTTDGSNIGEFESKLENLVPNTQYYVRAYATSAKGTAYGEEVTFTTLAKLLPEVTTGEVTDITVSSATCKPNVTFAGNVDITECGVCWSTTPTPTIEDNKDEGYHLGMIYNNGIGSWKVMMTDLEHNTTYYVRAYATNEVGTAYGEEVSFTTVEKLLPTVITGEVTNITVTSAKCSGEVTSDGNSTVTVLGHCWSTTPNPTIEDDRTEGSGLVSYTSTMTDLEHNTTYYVRAYATNEFGTAYGEEVSFTTVERNANGYEYIDLGLSVKWATCNVGATLPEEYGDYFAWGEITTKAEYTGSNSMTNVSMNDIAGNAQYDAATANWGGTWRMPTSNELNELRTKCTWTWTTQNGVKGYKVTGPNGNSIFLPAAGYRSGSSLYYAGSDGYYLSSTPYESISDFVYYLYFSSAKRNMYYLSRYDGRSVRPVLE